MMFLTSDGEASRVLLQAVIITGALSAIAARSANEYRLIGDIFNRNGYNKGIKPSPNGSRALGVTVGVALTRIIDIDEKNQIMTTNSRINQGWLDTRLSWDPAEYGNIRVIRIPYNSIWLPDVILYNTAEISSPDMSSISSNVIVNSEGNVTWFSMGIFKSSCLIDFKYIPFDEQKCSMVFSSWSYDASELNIKAFSDKADLSNYVHNSEWHLVSYTQERNMVFFSCCPEPYVFMEYSVVIQRRPVSYICNMVMPCLLITLVALLGFYMPHDSGEKITIGVMSLVSMIVFLMFVAEQMPPTNGMVPVIGLYYGLSVAIIACATGMSVVTLNIYHKRSHGHEIPGIIKTIFLTYLAKLVCVKDPSPTIMTNPKQYYANETGGNLQNGGPSTGLDQKIPTVVSSGEAGDNADRQFSRVLEKVGQAIEKNEMRSAAQEQRDRLKQEWQQLALVLDRVLLALFVFVTVCVTLGIFL